MKVVKKAKEVFFVTRVTVIETTVEIKANDENEAVTLVAAGKGEILGSDTHVHIKIEE